MEEDYQHLSDEEQHHIESSIRLETQCLEQFIDEAELTSEQLEQLQDNAVVIHDKMVPDDLIDCLEEWVDESHWESYLEHIEASRENPRTLFDKINESLPEAERLKKLGTVQDPVPADIYIPGK